MNIWGFYKSMTDEKEETFWKIPKPNKALKILKEKIRSKAKENGVHGKQIVRVCGMTLKGAASTAISLILMLQLRDYISIILSSFMPSGEGIFNQTIITLVVIVFSVVTLYWLEQMKS
jgi:hypothetical protein